MSETEVIRVDRPRSPANETITKVVDRARAESSKRIRVCLERGASASAILSIALGITVLAGWYWQPAKLLPALDGSAAMQPNSAIAFVLCGIALLSTRRAARAGALLAGSGAGLLGLWTLFEYAFGFDLRMNEWLLGLASASAPPELGRMAPSTALCFLLAASSCVIAANFKQDRAAAPLMGLLGAIISGIGAITCVAYVAGLTDIFPWSQFGGMGLRSALGFIIVGCGIVALGWIAGSQSAPKLPRWLPLLVGAAGLTATLILWQVFVASEALKTEQMVRNEAIHVHNQIASHVNSIMFEFLRSAKRWERFDLEAGSLEGEATNLLQWLRGVRAVGWLDTHNRLRWMVPKDESSALWQADFAAHPQHRAALGIARTEGMALSAAGDSTATRGEYFIFAPIADRSQPRGFIVGIFNARELLDDLIEDEAYIGYSIALFDGVDEIYRRRGSQARYQNWTQQSLISLGKVTWSVRVWPKPAALSAMESKADLIALLIGALGTALLVAITYLAQMAGVRAGQVQAFNEQLRREIAERVTGESQLRDSEAHYRELFEKAGDSISLISSDGSFIAVNPGFEAMTGFAAKDWIGKPFTAILHREDLRRIRRYFEKMLRAATGANFELRFLTRSGDYRIGEVNASPRYQHGQVAGVMAVVRDVTERKRADAQIQLQLERISALREINLAVTSTLDLRSVLSVLVQTIERLLPYSALLVWLKDHETGELKRAACWNLDEKDWMTRKLSGIPALVRTAMEERRPIVVPNVQTDPRTLDRDFYRRNGLISYLGVPLLTQHETLGVLVFLTREAHEFDDGEVSFLVSVASQTGVAIQNSQLYEKIHKQAAELEKANSLQADFTAMIAHDLRSPLSNIIGIADMMQQGLFGPVCEEQKNWLERMHKNGKNLVRLVSDFLDVSKLESGSIELQNSSTDVLDLIRNIVVNYQPVATRKNIALTCAGDDSLAPIQADPRRLDQVITNLLSNALKFTDEGGAVEIRVVPEQQFGIRVEVQDSGIGIAAGEIANLFQKYRQADSTQAFAHQGTGLGLVICKMIVEAHGGKIWIESTEGKGTTFFLTLPDQAQATIPSDGTRARSRDLEDLE